MKFRERRLTSVAHGHILTNIGVWSPDGRWIYYDVRSDAAGSVFDGDRIEKVDRMTGATEVVYASSDGACCGVVTCHPHDDRIVFIHGPEHPTAQWSYAASRRRGVWMDANRREPPATLDACDLVEPYTAGALRGGSHVHTWSGDGQWIAFTYEDQVLSAQTGIAQVEANRRLVGVAIPDRPVSVPRSHERNHDGTHFSVVVTRACDSPDVGSDAMLRACSDSWIGVNGYLNLAGKRQAKAIACLGRVPGSEGTEIDEVFIVDLPEDLTVAGTSPLQGTRTTRPTPPLGVRQRRVTWTADRKYPGISGPRHWVRSSPDGSKIATLMKDDHGVVQLWLIDTADGSISQLTHHRSDIGSALSWSADGAWIAHAMEGEVAVTSTDRGETTVVTSRPADAGAVRPEACVWSPEGRAIAFVRPVKGVDGRDFNQVCVAEMA